MDLKRLLQKWIQDRITILMFGGSGHGKTALSGELAEALQQHLGLTSVLYAGDPGGWDTVGPQKELGIVRVVECGRLAHPWEWMDAATKGLVLDGTKWVANPDSKTVGLHIFEGIVSYGEVLLQDLQAKAAQGIALGGPEPVVTFADGARTVSSNRLTDFYVVQGEIKRLLRQSFQLPGMVVWTTTAQRTPDQDLSEIEKKVEKGRALPRMIPILAPQGPGKALNSELPRMFVRTFHLLIPPDNAREHRLYFEPHTDIPGAMGLSNSRLPLGAEPLPDYLKPASLVRALVMIEERKQALVEKMRGGQK